MLLHQISDDCSGCIHKRSIFAQIDVHAWQIGDTLEEFLTEATDDSKLRQVVMSLSEAVRTIAFKVRPPGSFQLYTSQKR